MKERWRKVVGFEDSYRVSSKGRVLSIERFIPMTTDKNTTRWGNKRLHRVPKKILKLQPHGRYGHLVVKLYKTGKGPKEAKEYGVGPLVLTAFVGPCPEGIQCRHLDGNPQNNHLDNLRWGTQQENMDDRERHGRHHRGSKSVKAKLTEEDIPNIRKLLKKYQGVWGGMSKIARKYGVHAATIRDIRDGLTWAHVT